VPSDSGRRSEGEELFVPLEISKFKVNVAFLTHRGTEADNEGQKWWKAMIIAILCVSSGDD
jgi:hypothetical protein